MTDFANIPKDDLGFIVNIPNEHLKQGCYQLFIFGSRSQEAPCKTHSDLDIAVKMDTAIPRKTLFKIEEDFEESNLNYQVDLLDLHRISDSFSRSIHHKLVPISPSNKTENLPP
jgi:predicted nucleotidyltransferase